MSGQIASPTPLVLSGDLDHGHAVALHSVPRLAWDIETSGLDWRESQIGTCQLHAPEIGTIVVQLNGTVPARMRELLSDPGVRKVFHHAPFDLRFMTRHWDVTAASVACTKIASKLLAPRAPNNAHSLQSLLEQHLEVRISKQERLSDWLTTDLSDAQLRYAAADVTHLLPLLDLLEKHLANAGLSQLYTDCIEFLPARVHLETGGFPDVFAY